MQHKIPVENLSQWEQQMLPPIQACVHCGFCLSACPTYKVLRQEMDSPRGRIILMKKVLEGDLQIDQVSVHIEQCLGCLACETACPSGVSYRDLIGPFRVRLEQQQKRSLADRLKHRLIMETLPSPKRFQTAIRLGRWLNLFSFFIPTSFRSMFQLLPESVNRMKPLPAFIPAQGKRRAKVAMLSGCVQSVLDGDIGWATIEVLSRNGVEVVVPPHQGCCGALAAHSGEEDQAKACALTNFDAFPRDVDAIITNAAGCASGMHEYEKMFSHTEYAERAREVAQQTVDICVFLDQLGMIAPPPLQETLRVAYHDACHLRHAQSVYAQPRRLLGLIENLEVVEVEEGDICCGSAGTYNIYQPEIAEELGRRKVQHILEARPNVVAAGNIGCLVQIRSHFKGSPSPPAVYHTIQVIHKAYQGKLG